MKKKTLVLIAALFVTLACAAQSQAQALRTFVAVAGSDANDCTFGYALSHLRRRRTQHRAGRRNYCARFGRVWRRHD